MGDVPGRGTSSVGGTQTQHIGDSVSNSSNVNFKSTTDHVNNLPMLILESCQTSHHVVRQAFPVWTSMENSHPFTQLSGCLTAFIQRWDYTLLDTDMSQSQRTRLSDATDDVTSRAISQENTF